ncbi:MAG: MlaD family protein, partial [Solirubrobacterales bacterium]
GNPPHRIRSGLILIALVIVGTYLAWTMSIPFTPEYEVKAVFENSPNVRKDSPVRLAGVNVGEVVNTRSVGNASEVTFTVNDAGRPVHADAQFEVRPRIFLEGNFFLDVRPGSPSAPELPDGGTIPITHTSTAVQLDQLLTSLQAPDRENLQKLLAGYGTALNHQPTAAEDRTQDPDVQGETAAESINDSFAYGATAARDSAIVNEALQGTQPHDLSNLIAAQADLFGALRGHEQELQGLVTNFNTTIRAFAVESDNLARSVKLLAPTLERATPALRHTDQSLPFLRTWARDIEPGIRELPATIAASGPWLTQANALLRPGELGYIADELRRTGPGAGSAVGQGKGLLSQVGLLSTCFTNVFLPAGDVVLDDNFSTGVPNFEEFGYAAAQLAGSLQNFDGNGPYLRAFAGNGPVTASAAQPGGGPANELLVGHVPAAPLGTRPLLGPKPSFNSNFACQNTPVPDLNGPAAAVGAPSPAQVP